MIGRVPVLRKDDVLEAWRNATYDGDDFVTLRHAQCATGAKIILNVYDQQNVLSGDLHGPAFPAGLGY